jgi:hypothetical protein
MAKGGSGDVLTEYSQRLPVNIRIQLSPRSLVFTFMAWRGYAAEKYSMEAMIAVDIIENLGEQFYVI